MNVDAEITVEEVKDVVTVPVSAVMRGNMVAVKSTGKSEDKKETGAENKEKGQMPQSKEGKGMPEGKGGEKQMPRAFGQELPEGFELRRVEVGLSNSDSVEIVSGLKEGDIILVRQVEATSLQNMMMGAMGGGRMPSGGGMPMGGGMPSGGMRQTSSGGNRNFGGNR